MWLDPRFWTHHFENVFTKQITVFCDSILDRVLSSFDDIDIEAEKMAEQEYERLGNLPANDEFVDMGVIAEAAHDVGLEYFELMTDTRQALLNISTVGLHHLFEQQLLLFYRRQVLHPTEENDVKLLDLRKMQMHLAEAGIQIDSLPSWSKIKELRLVANTIKHGDGNSAATLHKLRQDLFIHPSLRDDNFYASLAPRVYLPSGGEDLFVQADDFRAYKQAILNFWNEFSELILKKGAK